MLAAVFAVPEPGAPTEMVWPSSSGERLDAAFLKGHDVKRRDVDDRDTADVCRPWCLRTGPCRCSAHRQRRHWKTEVEPTGGQQAGVLNRTARGVCGVAWRVSELSLMKVERPPA